MFCLKSVSLLRCAGGTNEPQVRRSLHFNWKSRPQLGTVPCTCNTSTQEAKEEVESQASQGYGYLILMKGRKKQRISPVVTVDCY